MTRGGESKEVGGGRTGVDLSPSFGRTSSKSRKCALFLCTPVPRAVLGTQEGWTLTMLAMAEVNTSRTEKMPTAVLCARERTMLRDRCCRPLGNSCGWQEMRVGGRINQG